MNMKTEEVNTLQKFSVNVSDLNQDSCTLLRFLRARDGNIEKAEEMLRKSVKWREENRVSSYRSWNPPEALAKDFLFQYLGLDKYGYPVMYIPLGKWNVRDRMENGYLKESFDFRFYLLENVLAKLMETMEKEQLVLIVDMAGLSFYKMAHINTMNMITTACQDFDQNYPETLRTSFIVNAPWMFPYAFSMVKPWMSPKTLTKMHIFDSNKSKWLKSIEETMSIDILPKQVLS